MPYIKQDRRASIARGEEPLTAGELNYCITKLCLSYLERGTYNYQALNDVIGALESAKLEMYRRRVAGYEDNKLNLHGDVY